MYVINLLGTLILFLTRFGCTSCYLHHVSALSARLLCAVDTARAAPDNYTA